MLLLKSLIYGVGKYIYGTALGFNLYTVYLNATSSSETYIDSFLENTPAKVLTFIGILIAFVRFLVTLSDAWTKIQINKEKVKREREISEQEGINTDIKEVELVKIKKTNDKVFQRD